MAYNIKARIYSGSGLTRDQIDAPLQREPVLVPLAQCIGGGLLLVGVCAVFAMLLYAMGG